MVQEKGPRCQTYLPCVFPIVECQLAEGIPVPSHPLHQHRIPLHSDPTAMLMSSIDREGEGEGLLGRRRMVGGLDVALEVGDGSQEHAPVHQL